MVLCFAFFYVPIIITMIFSFNSSKSFANFTGFSLRWYESLINDSEILSAVGVSVSVAVIATVVSTILGTITAIGLSKSRKILKEWVLNINNIPIMSPDIVTAIGLMILFTSVKLEKGYFTMLLAHICFCTPYVITSVYPKVRSVDVNIANAAMDLGATPFQALTKVIVPMIKPGIYAGMLLAFTMSIDDFVISYFVSGNGVENISMIVYNATKRINPTINALSTVVIMTIFVVVFAVKIAPVIAKQQWFRRLSVKIPLAVKRVFLFASCAAVVFSLIQFGGIYRGGTTKTLKVYNAGEYIDESLLELFEEQFDCKVIYETFDSNESMYTKVMSGEKYDIIIPSDYMIERLAKEDFLQPVDKSLLDNFDNVIPAILNQPFDPENQYSIPYFWGNVGILYDSTVVRESDLEAGWEILRNPDYKDNIYMYDSERDSFMIALKALGYSLNTTDKSELDRAYEWLSEQKRLVNPVYVGDDVIDNMVSGYKAMAVVYSGDAAYIMSENENMRFYAPECGTNLWIDGMVITKDCKNTALAHDWIDFMLEDENAAVNTEMVGYSSPVEAVYTEISQTVYEGNEAYVPRQDNPKDEYFRYQDPEIKKYSAELWTKVKTQ
ncbi:MAG: extracellular solute-binding protein [Clostridia bacterium]|nr:extracellular solute-binding protein [Clostridia bacterium]